MDYLWLQQSFYSWRYPQKNKELIKLQGQSHLLFALAGIIIKGYSGAVQDSVGCLRNLLIYYDIDYPCIKILFLVISLFGGLLLNNSGIVGFLPIIGTIQYTFISTTPGVTNNQLQSSIILNSLLMIIYSFAICNFVNVCTNLIVILLSIQMLQKNKKFSKEWTDHYINSFHYLEISFINIKTNLFFIR